MTSRFLSQLEKRVLFFDGAMGTSIHQLDLDLQKDYLGRENCTEALILGNPGVIQTIHESFLAVGADAVETDTFNASIHTMEDQDLQDRVHEINKTAAEIARAACDKFATPDHPRFVLGSVGPGTKLITLGQISWDAMFESYREQARGLIDGGIDVFLIETQQDLLAVKCIINAMLAGLADRGKTVDDIPIMVQVTIEQQGSMLTGSEIAAAAVALREYPIISLGLNCATGPTDMAEHIGWLAKHWDRHISVLPNAGLPVLVNGEAQFPLGAQSFAETLGKFVDDYGLSIVGGCCGTMPAHIDALIQKVGRRPRKMLDRSVFPPACTSLYTPTEYRQDLSLLNIGERCNASGSRAFKKLLEVEDWDAMVSLARDQMKEGSHVLDVNVDYAGRDNAKDMAEIVSRFVRQVNAPLMLDSTQANIIEAGLKHAGGKCLINSANLEEGEEKFAQFCNLAKTYNAGLVLGTIDEDPEEAMARTADRKVAIAKRMVKLATEKYGLTAGDLFIDTLVLPISTGMEKDRRSALETIEGTRRIHEELPEVQLTCGLSNVSFGLKPAARQVLNSAFLHELTEAGMTSAIIHVSKILPKNRIDPAQWDAAVELIYNRWRAEGDEVTLQDGNQTRDPLQVFINLFPDDASEVSTKQEMADLPLEERLQKHIVDGEKKNLEQTLEEAMAKYPPLDIINNHLLEGMKVVGELFGSGQMQLPFVLQSAEVMKKSVAYLEPHMEKVEGQTKGTIVLATVKGDVHDIGKNLVDIILSNNGYTVHNLGIKQPIGNIVAKWKETKADAIGLSGLLVKSVTVMEENLKELNELKIDVPMLLGGAALSKHYCDSHLRSVYQGKVYHGRDAFEGLRIMDLLKTGKLAELDAEIETRLTKRADAEEKFAASQAKKQAAEGAADSSAVGVLERTRSDVRTDVDVPTPPFWGSRVVETVALDHVLPYVNRIALYRGQWQMKKGKKSDAEYAHQIKHEVDPIFNRLAQQAKDENILRPQVVYGYFPAQSDGDDLIVFDPQDRDRELERFTFPRQPGRQRLCISDFFKSVDSGQKDVIGFSCVTMGAEASRRTKELFAANEYTEYLYLHGFSVESAEGLAEMWHKRMRQELGIGGDDAATIPELFTQHYRGSRYSFGYPACPEMSDQEKLFRLIQPERIGCVLTENWQIDPEQSTSAIIVHHPEAKYYGV